MSAKAQTPQRRSSGGMPPFIKNTHVYLYRLTGGAIGGKMGSRPLLLLTTTGRKSGKERVTPLLYIQDGDTYLLAASAGGADNHPQWYRNLLANPKASIQIGKQSQAVTARTATAEERPRVWALFTNNYSNFAGYERKTTREIPVVILTPTA